MTENITLDGVIDAAGDWFGPAQGDASDQEAAIRRHMGGQAALVLGRVTFEELRSYWPAQTGDTTGIHEHLERVPKHVVSTTLEGDPGWAGTTVWGSSWLDDVARLRDRVDGEVGVTGSISIARQLVAADLVDEYRLFVHPVVVGSGRRLFDGEAVSRRELRLVETTPFRNGIVLLTYR